MHTIKKHALGEFTYSTLKVNFLFHFLLINNTRKRENFLHYESKR